MIFAICRVLGDRIQAASRTFARVAIQNGAILPTTPLASAVTTGGLKNPLALGALPQRTRRYRERLLTLMPGVTPTKSGHNARRWCGHTC
eukprot:COSAG02_NODE_45230_length_359_cov_0.650000_1_plen_89_part_10